MKDDALFDDATLHETAQRLGAREAERLDVERTAQAVVERLRREPAVPAPAWVRPGWLRIAAAVVVLVGAGLITRDLFNGSVSDAHPGHYVVEDLGDLTVDDLQQVLATLDETLVSTAASEAGLDGLTEAQLREVLRSLEG
ncbi:MAG: hypothetical protein ACREL9_01305 [Gemmatimonadales bacterium]